MKAAVKRVLAGGAVPEEDVEACLDRIMEQAEAIYAGRPLPA